MSIFFLKKFFQAISAKHLALCSESVAAVRAVVQCIAADIDEINGKAKLQEAVEEMAQHERDLEAKLVNIMRDLAASQNDPSGSLGLLADRTQNLFRILEKVLPKHKLAHLFDSIYAVYMELFDATTPQFERLEALRAACLKQ